MPHRAARQAAPRLGVSQSLAVPPGVVPSRPQRRRVGQVRAARFADGRVHGAPDNSLLSSAPPTSTREPAPCGVAQVRRFCYCGWHGCGVRDVTDDELQECAKAALDFYASVSGLLRVPQEGTIKFQATFPIAMYALNQVHGALMLAERNREYLAVANVRVAYEHAVTAQWVLFTDGAEEKLIGSINRHSRKVIKAMASRTVIPDELQTGFGRDGDPTMPNFWKRCEDLDGGNGSLYFYYQVLTEAIHPSVATLRQHLQFDGDHISGVNFGAVHAPPPDLWIACAVSALSAAATIEVQREGQPRMPQILELSEKHQVPFDLSAR